MGGCAWVGKDGWGGGLRHFLTIDCVETVHHADVA